MKRKGVIITICVMGVCLCEAAVATADDGYGLWLKYKKVEDPQKLEAYRKAITNYDIYGNSPTCEAIRGELKRGLNGLLGENVHTGKGFHRPGGVVMVGTAENCPMVKKFDFTPLLERTGREGYIIKMDDWNGIPIIIISANEDVGLLYGTLNFLRLLKTWESLEKNINPEIYVSVMAKLEKQKIDAGIWRDTCLDYFGKFSKKNVAVPATAKQLN